MNADNDKEAYKGPEQRSEHRRKNKDRREDIRFEPDKEDRRQKPGRRKSDHDPWFKHGV